MRSLIFAKRVSKEIIRDPLTAIFGLGFPLVLIYLLSAIQANVPVDIFGISSLTPGITVFGFSFLTLFCAMIVSKDRSSSFIKRIYTTRLRSTELLIGYALPMLPIAAVQTALIFAAAFTLGLPFSAAIPLSLVCGFPTAIFYIFLGLLLGSLLNEKQVGGICGALITNLTAFLSGAWFDIRLVGGAFEGVASVLPFLHAVELQRAILASSYGELWWRLAIVCGYAISVAVIACIAFKKRSRD